MNKDEIKKIITLGDIFDNLETEEQAFKFLKYIKNQQQELDKYKNIVDELEKFLIEWENKSWEDNGAFKDVYDYLQELKGSDE